MIKERKIDPEKIHLVNIRTIKGNIDAATDIDSNAIAGHQFNFGLGTGINLTDNIIGLLLEVSIEAKDKADKPLNVKGSYTHEIVFKVDNLIDFLEPVNKEGNNSYNIDGGLGSTLVSIAYSTVRGIIFTRTQSTSLGSVMLPIIDPKKLMGQ
jgi:hypothetical protein